MKLEFVDWCLISGYLAASLAIGWGFRRRAGRSLADFFVSGRSLPWWLAGTSMVATTFAADTPLAVTGLVAAHGLAGNWVWWSFAVGGMITVFFFAPLWRRAEVMTDVELIELRYHGRPAAALRMIRAIYVALVVNPIIIGWVTKAMVVFLRQTVLFPSDGRTAVVDDVVILAGLLLIVGFYCTLSGMWGVVITDFLQFCLAMMGCVILAVVAVRHLGGMHQIQARVAQQFPEGQQAFAFFPDLTATDAWMPLHVFLIYILVQWWATWYPGAEPGGGGYVVQRMAACRDERQAVLATLWYQVAHYCIRPWPWFVVAFAAMAMYPDLRALATDESFRQQQQMTANVGFPRVIRDLSPPGLRGLMLVTFFAAFMSTISTQVNWGASYLVRDVYQRFLRPDASDAQLTRVSRWVSVAMLVVGGGVSAWMIRSQVSIDEAWKFLLALGAGTGAVYMLRWYWWRINAWSELSAMMASLVYFASLQGRFAEPEVTILVVALATVVTWLVVTLLTGPERKETLIAFYRLVRPGGPGWQPIAQLAPDVSTDRLLGWRLLAALSASAIVFLTLPGVGALLFGNYGRGALLLGAAAVAAWVVGRIPVWQFDAPHGCR